MDASAGTTTTVFQSYTMKNIGTSCRKTFRPQVNMSAPTRLRWSMSGSQQANGQPTSTTQVSRNAHPSSNATKCAPGRGCSRRAATSTPP